MVGLSYRGRAPDSDSALVTKKWSDDTNATKIVDTAFINAEIAQEIIDQVLQTTSYVDTQDALRAKKTAVDAADANYVLDTALNAANGVAGLDSSGNLISSQVPTGIVTDFVVQSFKATGAGLILSGEQQVTTTAVRAFKIATLAVTDPGYPWIPIPFGGVMGWSGGTPPGSRLIGTGTTGKLVVCPPSGQGDDIYGIGICTGAFDKPTPYMVVPYGSSSLTPSTRPPLTGGKTLDLYGSCFAGSGYVFSSAVLFFHVMAFPAV